MPRPISEIGDFNTHTKWDAKAPRANHSTIVSRLGEDFGLISSLSGAAVEPPTHYFQWKQERPFHIDYRFSPARVAAASERR